MVAGTMEFRIGNEKRTMKPGDVALPSYMVRR
jgi:quercetin dioxygenase-like cupin family protein